MIDDEHLGDGASVALRARERFVVDHHISGERVERRGVGVDQHRVGGTYRLQVHGRLAGDVELVKEAREEALETARACVGYRLVGEANLVDKIGEVARCADVGDALQRVVASAIGRAGWLRSLGRKRVPVQNRSPNDGAPGPTVGAKCRVVGATYANGWLIIAGASKMSPVPGSGMRRRHARRRI